MVRDAQPNRPQQSPLTLHCCAHTPLYKTLRVISNKIYSPLILGLCLLLFPSTKVIAAGESCSSPSYATLSSIKAKLVAEINSVEIVRSGQEREMTSADVEIMQVYEKDGFVLVSYLYRCCFEGRIVLFKKSGDKLETVGYYNGYDDDGVFVGFEKKLVVQSLSKLVPQHVKNMIACYQ